MIRERPMTTDALQKAIDDMVAARCTERDLLRAARQAYRNVVYRRHSDRSQRTYLLLVEADDKKVDAIATLTRIDGAWWVYPYMTPDERLYCDDWTDSSGYPVDTPDDLIEVLPRLARSRSSIELEAS